MATYTSIINPGLVNAEGEQKYLNRLFTPGVAMGITTTSLAIGQRGAGANMSVDIAVGDALLQLPTTAYGLWGWTDAVTNLTITAANASLGRVDVVVAWVDTTVTTTVSANNPGSFKFSAIAGTPSGSPVAVTDTVVQSTLGASVAWVKLGYVFVGAAVSSITTGVITDARTAVAARTSTIIPAFRAYLTTAQTSANNAIVQLSSKDYDNLGNFNTSTYSFTAPYPCIMHFSWNIQTSVGNNILSGISKNSGAVVARGAWIAGSTFVGSSGSSDLLLATNDTVQLVCVVVQGTQTIDAGTTSTYMSGHLVTKM